MYLKATRRPQIDRQTADHGLSRRGRPLTALQAVAAATSTAGGVPEGIVVGRCCVLEIHWPGDLYSEVKQ